jgi:hypothetical protein
MYQISPLEANILPGSQKISAIFGVSLPYSQVLVIFYIFSQINPVHFVAPCYRMIHTLIFSFNPCLIYQMPS